MPRKLRAPVGGQLVEATTKTLQGRFLLRPSPRVNAIIKGILGRAQTRYSVEIVIAVAMSNHIQALLIPDSNRELSRFMRYVNSNLARKIGRLHNWKGKFWSRRYQAIPVTDEETAQVRRLLYILRHGAKEGLVMHPSQWPGVQFIDELTRGFDIVHGGIWHDQSGEYNARRGSKKVVTRDFVESQNITLAKLPCWAHLSWQQYAQEIRHLVQTIEEETRAHHQQARTSPLGAKAILRQDPHHQPEDTKSTPAPHCHASSREKRAELLELYRAFVNAFRHAADRLRQGVLDAAFPEGAFPPRLPWVPEARSG